MMCMPFLKDDEIWKVGKNPFATKVHNAFMRGVEKGLKKARAQLNKGGAQKNGRS